MKSSMLATVAVACALVFAPSARAQAPATPAVKSHTMTGCLAKGTADGSYMLTNVEGKGPKTVGIVSSTTNLAPHVGHKVAITGTAVPAAEAEMNKSVPKAPHYMKLTAMKHIAATCS